MKFKHLVLTAIVSLFMSLYISAATITVINTNDSGAGSLRQAIVTAAPGDTINFTVTGTITLTSGELSIDKDLTIQGPGASLLSISGNHASRVFCIENLFTMITTALDGMTIRDGYTDAYVGGGYGAGISNRFGTLSITNSSILGNTALGNTANQGPYGAEGGGIYNSGSLTINNSTVSGNTAVTSGNGRPASGGGIHNPGSLSINNSTISGNTAANDGGGIWNNGSVMIRNSNVSGNALGAGDGRGGGIFNIYTFLSIMDSTISGNTSGNGIYNEQGTLTVGNSTVSSNGGDGILNSFYCLDTDGCTFAIASFTNSTISGNTGLGFANRVTCRPDICLGGPDAYAYLVNSVISGNTAGEFQNSGTIATASHNLIGDAASSGGITNGVNGNIVGVNPMLGPLQNNGGPAMTHALLVGSPAIDAGDNALAVDGNGQPLLYDQRGAGFSRIVGGTVDIGAFERQGTTAAMVSVSGRVLTADGRGVRGAYVTISGPGGTRMTTTGRLGNYRFDDVAAGADYMISVAARRFQFQPRVVQVYDELTNVDLIGENLAR